MKLWRAYLGLALGIWFYCEFYELKAQSESLGVWNENLVLSALADVLVR